MKITDDHLEVTEPEIAALFLGEEVMGINIHEESICGKLMHIEGAIGDNTYGVAYVDDDQHRIEWVLSIRIPKETVKKVWKSGAVGTLINKLQLLEEELMEWMK